MVIWLVGAVLVFSQDSRPEAAALVREVDPAMGGDFELALLRVGPLNGAHVPVVSGIYIRWAERESDFEIGRKGSPIDGVVEFHPVARIACRKSNRLHEFRVFALARHL